MMPMIFIVPPRHWLSNSRATARVLRRTAGPGIPGQQVERPCRPIAVKTELGRSQRGMTPAGREGNAEDTMLLTIAVLFLILWVLGLVSSYTLGGLIHILLFLAIAAVLIRIIQGRRPI
jgi:hypothetical protein